MSTRIILPLLAASLTLVGGALAADQVKGPFAGAVHAVGSLADRSANPAPQVSVGTSSHDDPIPQSQLSARWRSQAIECASERCSGESSR